MLKLTEKAKEMLEKMMAEENSVNSMIRLYIRGVGWGGPSFGMSLEEAKEEQDAVEEVNGIKFVLDQRAQLYLGDATVDYRKSLLGEGFSIIPEGAPDGGTC